MVESLLYKLRRSMPVWLSLGLLAVAVVASVAESATLVTMRNAIFDAYQRWHPRPYEPVAVRVVDIDDESLERLGQWPWPRTILADLVSRLRSSGAAAVALDITFPEPDRSSPALAFRSWAGEPGVSELIERLPDHDRIFAEQIAKGGVVTGFVLTHDESASRLPASKASIVVAGDDPNPFLPSYQGSVTTLTRLEAGAAGNGALNVAPSRDGIVRRVQLLLRLGDRIYPALAAEALRTALGDANYVVKSSGASGVSRLAEQTGIRSVRIGGLAMTTDQHGGIWLHYSAPVDERVIPAWRVLAGQAPRDALAGAIVFVGTSAAGLKDLRLNPLGHIVAGAEIHAQVVEQMLQGTYLRRPDWAKAAEILFMVLMWALLVGSVLRFGAAWAAILGAVALAASYGGSWLAFTEARLLLDPTVPSLTALAVYLVCSLSRQLRTERDKRWIRKAFSSYISPNLVKYLIDNPDELDLGGHRRLCSFVMSDLAGFTSLVENTDPAVVVALLNEYLDGMVGIALRHEGTLDRIVGDAVAVMFSAPVVQPDHAARAVACALDMDDFAQGFSERKRAEGVAVGHTRIGVNTGLVTIGNVGGQSLVDYRALGDAVNTSARLETVNRHLGTRICVSGATAAACPGFTGRPVGTLVLVGKGKGVKAFEPLTPQRAASTAVVRYLEAFELLAQGDDGAEAAFDTLVQEHPDDPLAALHLERLRAGETGVTIVMSKK